MTINDNIIRNIVPTKVINTRNESKDFKFDKMYKVLNNETGLDIKKAKDVCIEVLYKIIKEGYTSIKTTEIREMICLELTKRDLQKYRNLFYRKVNLNDIYFKLDEDFLQKYKGKQPDWGELGYFTYKRTYARYIEEEDRTEEFWETVKRVVEGCFSIQKEHCKSIGIEWNEEKSQRFAHKMYEKIWNFKFTPSGRGLWMMGTDFVNRNGSMSLNSCAFTSTKNIDTVFTKPFEYCMDSLMLGVGVGYDVLGESKINIKKPNYSKKTFEIPDSREGWVEALKKVLEGYFKGIDIPDLDYSLIRPAGERIRGFGGVSSGSKPLYNLLEKEIPNILNPLIGKPITQLAILDIMNLIAKCVIAGNVRRSAEISLGKHNDKEFITCKRDKQKLKHHRWASNNSIFGKVGMDYSEIVKHIKVNGEPAVFWLENARKYSRMIDPIDNKDIKVDGINPCAEQCLESMELCNLVETFPSHHDTYQEFMETLKFAYIYGKSVTLINTHWKESNAVMLKNRRIGISQSGIIDAFDKHGRRTILNWSNKGYHYLRELDKKYSKWLCINESIKITTVKPSGSVSLLAGVSSGIHYPHSKYYIRRVRISDDSKLVEIMKDHGYTVEKDTYSKDTDIIVFPIKKDHFIKSKREASIWEQVANVIDYQRYWSDNQVSVTVTFNKKEAEQLESVLEFVEDKLKAISFLPLNDHGYEQAPYEEINKEEYEKMIDNVRPIECLNAKNNLEGLKYCTKEGCN